MRSLAVGACLGACLVGCREKQGAKSRAAGLVAQAPDHASQRSASRHVTRKLALRYRLHAVDRRLPPQPAIERYVAPFRRKMHLAMDQILTHSTKPLLRARPESLIGNLISDVAMAHMKQVGKPVDAFITNLGGIRNDIAAGPITLRTIYECLPFENKLIRAKISGQRLADIVAMIARRGGEPVAGLRFRISRKTHKPSRIRVGRKPLRPKASYWLGSSGYVARTGFLKPFLRGVVLEKTTLLLRDSVIWGLRRKVFLKKLRKDRRIAFVR